jgi:AbrB family looped-hinge helix DNA binding protein
LGVLGTSPLSKQGQITVPKIVRDKLDLTAGDIVAFYDDGGRIFLKKG